MVEWFDDLKLGMHFRSGEVTVSKEDIIRFAAEYDPQPFHLDEEAAKKTILGGLAASGWHTAAIAMRLAASSRPFGPPGNGDAASTVTQWFCEFGASATGHTAYALCCDTI